MVDFASRNPVNCDTESCPTCKELLSVDTTFHGAVLAQPNLYLASAAAWRDVQQSCPDLRRVHALLQSGKSLSKKEKKAQDVRSYLRLCTINKTGLLVHLKQVPFQAKPAELIVIPRSHAFTFAKALHIRLNHPLPSQFHQQFSRQYFILNQKDILLSVYNSCDVPCQAAKLIPKETMTFVSETKPSSPGTHLNADVLVEAGQKILLVRDNLTSYTATMIIKNEQKEILKESLFTLASSLRLGRSAVIRVDAHSSLAALKNDGSLDRLGFSLDVGHPKNVNKNATAEKGIRELREQIIRVSPKGGPISSLTLARATDGLNNIIRHTGRTAKELWTGRDSLTGDKLDVSDSEISRLQQQKRLATHHSSALYQSRSAPPVKLPVLKPGDEVVVKSDRSKSAARDMFVVLQVDNSKSTALIQKFPMDKFRRNPLTVQLQNLSLVSQAPRTASSLTKTNPSIPSPAPPRPTFLATPLCTPHTNPKTRQPTLYYSSDSDSDDEDWLLPPTPQLAPSAPPTPATPSTPARSYVSSSPANLSVPSSPGSPSPTPPNHAQPGSTVQPKPTRTPVREKWSFTPPHHPSPIQSSPPNPLQLSTPPPNPTLTATVPLVQPKAKSKNYLKPGERIVLRNRLNQTWVSATLTRRTNQYLNSSYYWYWQEDVTGNQSEGFLHQGEGWGVLRAPYCNTDVCNTRFVFPASLHQVDGAVSPPATFPLLNLTSNTLSPSPTNSRAPQSPLSPFCTPTSPFSPPLLGPVLNLTPTRPIPTFTWDDLSPPPADGLSPSPQSQFAPYSVPVIFHLSRLPLQPRCSQVPAPKSQDIQGDFLVDWWKPSNSPQHESTNSRWSFDL